MVINYNYDEIKSSPLTNLTPYSTASIIHSHTFWEFSLILDGICKNKINGNAATTMSKGNMFCLRPCDYHQLSLSGKNYLHRDFYVSVEKMEKICSLFSDTFYAELMNGTTLDQYEVNINNYADINEKANMLHQVNSYSPEFLENIHTIIIIELLGIISCAQNKHLSSTPAWLQQLFLDISNVQSFDYSIEEICKRTGYSHSNICKMFKRYYGTTLSSAITKNKITYSANMLGSKKIIDISLSLGWDNPKNYTIEFKKVFGITPSEYILKNNLKSIPLPKNENNPQ